RQGSSSGPRTGPTASAIDLSWSRSPSTPRDPVGEGAKVDRGLHAANVDSRPRIFQEGSPVPPGVRTSPSGWCCHAHILGGGRVERTGRTRTVGFGQRRRTQDEEDLGGNGNIGLRRPGRGQG